jgi:hypothetical protein
VKQAVLPLLLVLLIQCGLVAVVYWPPAAVDTGVGERQLATATAEQIDEIHVGDEYGNEAVLLRAGDRWRLPELGDLPADPDKVAGLLAGVLTGDPGWPIAESAAARQRFQVADYRYQRRLALLAEGEAIDTIYLGTAPAFRKVHARNDGDNAIFALDFNSFDAPALDAAWLDPRLLQVRAPLAIAADGYALSWRDGHWLAGSGARPDQRELDALLGALRTLQIEGVADEDGQRELAQSEADLVLQVTSLGGDATLELFTLNGEHFIHSSNHGLFFSLSAYDYDRLMGIDPVLISGAGPAGRTGS